ncbi:MAG: putative toxin-antitoxin system toxin component, PIN family [Bacteroidetes bacterium]|nr:putative toxin-antitoxin system toxin component, PIN family [Bacteroidota bacterium]
MNIVLDTNVLLVSISSKSKYRYIFDAFIDERYNLCITTDILFEYEEIIQQHMGHQVAETTLQLIENASNVVWVTKYYKWELIKADKDDNKFVDCAIAANAKYLVSDDQHFALLKNIKFPIIRRIRAIEFKNVLINNGV